MNCVRPLDGLGDYFVNLVSPSLIDIFLFYVASAGDDAGLFSVVLLRKGADGLCDLVAIKHRHLKIRNDQHILLVEVSVKILDQL